MTVPELHLLSVGLDQKTVEAMRSAFEQHIGSVLISTAASLAAIQSYVTTSQPDAVLVDIDQFLAPATPVSRTHLAYRYPLVVVSRDARKDHAANAYRQGAMGFVTSTQSGLARLPASVEHAISEFEQRQQIVSDADPASRFRSIVDMCRDLVAVFSIDGHLQYLNAAGRRVIGLDPDSNTCGMDVSNFFTIWELEKHRNQHIPDAIDYGFWRGDSRMIHTAGTEIDVSVLVLSNRLNGEVDSVSVIARATEVENKMKEWSDLATVSRQQLNSLSNRERQVFDLVVVGKANKIIAKELFLAEKTIEKHRARIKSKLKVSSVAELVRIGVMAEFPQNFGSPNANRPDPSGETDRAE